MKLKLTTLAALGMVAAAGTTYAQLRAVHDVPLALANEAAAAAVAECLAKGFNVSAAVVDRGGVLRTLQRADNAGPHTLDAARRKAFTSVSFKAATLPLMERIKNTPTSANVIFIADVLLLGGGVPLKVGDEVVGAIGVGGSPTGEADAQCAEAGIGKIADRLK